MPANIRYAFGMDIYVTTPAFGHRWRLRLLFLFARQSQSKYWLCTRSFINSKRRGNVDWMFVVSTKLGRPDGLPFLPNGLPATAGTQPPPWVTCIPLLRNCLRRKARSMETKKTTVREKLRNNPLWPVHNFF